MKGRIVVGRTIVKYFVLQSSKAGRRATLLLRTVTNATTLHLRAGVKRIALS